MNKKQLAVLIKELRQKKLAEVIGKPGPFAPVHHKATHGEDPESPNQYAHKMEEGRTPVTGKLAQGPATKGNQKYRKIALDRRSNHRQKGRYLNALGSHTSSMYEDQSEQDLGRTDTGKKGKESETVSINPNIPTAKGETTKNTTVKETKEK